MKFLSDFAWLLIGIVASWTNDGVQALVGGSPYPRNTYPWVAYVSCCTNTLGCNGVLIHSAIILTSAQCMSSSMTPAIPGPFCSVMMGGVTSGFQVDEDGEIAKAASYQEMARHPSFQLNPLQNDVGLIRLLVPFTLVTDVIGILPLPPLPPAASSNFTGKDLEIDSYSYPENTYAFSGTLQQIYLTEVPASTGNTFWQCSTDIAFSSSQHIYLRNDKYAAYFNATACYSDIGAPASYYYSGNRETYVVAFVSMLSTKPGGPCASKRSARQDSAVHSPQDDDAKSPDQPQQKKMTSNPEKDGDLPAGFGCTARPGTAGLKDRKGRQLPGSSRNKCSDPNVPLIGTRVEPFVPFITSIAAGWGITI